MEKENNDSMKLNNLIQRMGYANPLKVYEKFGSFIPVLRGIQLIVNLAKQKNIRDIKYRIYDLTLIYVKNHKHLNVLKY